MQRGLIFPKVEKTFEKLDKIPRVGAAGYDSGRPNAPKRCLEDTRTAVLEKIWCWIGPLDQDAATEPTPDTTDKPIYWVNGLAGIGKSTIARTVAEDAKDRNLLGASFFFSRQENKLSGSHLFVPTIAYQLARSYPKARSIITKVFQREPDFGNRSFATQVKELIVKPLSKITSKPV